MKILNGLYVITDNTLTPKESLLNQVKEALEGGAKIVQLRDKKNSIEEIKKEAIELNSLTKKYNAKFILNDEVSLAIELGCDGLHIGKSDYYRVKEIRENFKGILGVSCYGDIEKAKEMENIGVDYVAFGSFYSSPTKPNSSLVSLEVLEKAKRELNIPICAIGGINRENISEITKYNIDMVAVISDIWNSSDIKEVSKKYSSLF